MLSKSSIRKIGTQLRKFSRGEISPEDIKLSIDALNEYRQNHEPALDIVTSELTKIAAQLQGCTVSSRLKRVQTIYKKLTTYEQKMDLSRMQDIAGARLIAPDLDELYKAAALVADKWEGAIYADKDYIKTPRQSGYRAHHIIVSQNGYPVEIQLRTRIMHGWANIAESISQSLDENYKHDSGKGKLAQLLQKLSEVDALVENTQINKIDWEKQSDVILSQIVATVEARKGD